MQEVIAGPPANMRAMLAQRFATNPILSPIQRLERLRAFNELADKYEESHRKYHNLSHIWFCLQVFDLFQHLVTNSDAMELAIFYHDVIYDIGVPPRQNEEQSAAFAVRQLMKWHLGSLVAASVGAQVLATTHDHVPDFDDGKLIVDIDLAGFGAPWEEFVQNQKDVREEYSRYSDEEFRKGNGAVLEPFLKRTPLYYTPEIEAAFGVQAKQNLVRWLDRP